MKLNILLATGFCLWRYVKAARDSIPPILGSQGNFYHARFYKHHEYFDDDISRRIRYVRTESEFR